MTTYPQLLTEIEELEWEMTKQDILSDMYPN